MNQLRMLRWSVVLALRGATARARRWDGRRRPADASGQDLIEYAGMLAIIAVVVAAILMLHLPSVIANAIDDAVKSITGGGHSSASH